MYKNDYPNLAVLQLFERTEGECGKGVLPDTTFRFSGNFKNRLITFPNAGKRDENPTRRGGGGEGAAG